MKKIALLPGLLGELDSDSADEPQMSYAVATEHGRYRHVVFSGNTHEEGTLREQARTILEYFEEGLAAFGGGINDVIESRWYVREDELSREGQVALHEVRSEFFERPHYPASTMIGVASLLDDALVEIELIAKIPDDEWEVETIDLDDVDV
ncbi:RidA family protein [Natronococcus sp. A-GB1]|uniref:RidA family protein n=1 Tax=Natronococcus sp. A-GB1 TaxID=3037648 RepID=UPI00241CC31D|nr:RidA family protein [Natronococcus sp. A-GB1]MDG5758434.1 RidA family protein [Natronococcus sp. A-GB1]